MTIIADIEDVAKSLALMEAYIHRQYGRRVTKKELEAWKDDYLNDILNNHSLEKAKAVYEKAKTILPN